MRFALPPKPTEGETRTRSGFLFLPRGPAKDIRWLERATWIESHHYVITGGDMLSDSYGWRWFFVRWADEHKEDT